MTHRDLIERHVERITLQLEPFEFGLVAVFVRVTFVVTAEAAGQRFDQRRSTATARARNRKCIFLSAK